MSAKLKEVRRSFIALILAQALLLTSCSLPPSPTPSPIVWPPHGQATPEIEKLIAVTTLAQRLDTGCLLLPASSFRQNGGDGDGVHFYRHAFSQRYFRTQWSLLDSIWPDDSTYAGYVVDRTEMTPEELAYLGPLPRLSTVSIPYPDREAAQQAGETWAETKVASGTVRRADRGDVIYLERISPAANSLFNLYAAAVTLKDGLLVLLQSNMPDLIPALLDARHACLPAPLEAGSFVLPDALQLSQGSYDIPWHLEPEDDLTLTRREIPPASTNSEYIPVGADNLERITSLYHAATVSAYTYSPPAALNGALPVDEAELAANPIVQVCLGCITFYTSGTVLALEFPDQATAADFTAAIYATEFGARGGEAAKFKYGAVMTDESTAYLHSGRFFYVINSWMPETISAFLEQVE